MTVTVREIRRIAALARLRLDRGEAERLARDMSSILDHMEVLGAADLGPEASPGVPDPERPAGPGGEEADEASRPPAQPETTPDPLARPLSDLAPEWRDGLFVVPRLPGVAGSDDEPGGSS